MITTKFGLRRVAACLLGVAALSAASMLGIAGTASAASQAVSYHLQLSTPGEPPAYVDYQAEISASAPAAVGPGGSVTVTLSAGSVTVPGEPGAVKDVDLTMLVPVPANASYASCALSGGSNLNSTPRCALVGHNVEVTVPGPLNSGARVTLPTLAIKLTAGRSGAITTKLGGTSYNDPGVTVTGVVNTSGGRTGNATGSVKMSGYPDPNPVLTTTAIR